MGGGRDTRGSKSNFDGVHTHTTQNFLPLLVESMQGEGVFRALANGVHERGSGGVAFVKGEECAYLFPHEFKNETFRSGLEEAIDAGKDTHFFVVEERDNQLNVLAYEKKHVYSSLSRSIANKAIQDEVRFEERGGGEEGESCVDDPKDTD